MTTERPASVRAPEPLYGVPRGCAFNEYQREHLRRSEAYLAGRTGTYANREHRYLAAGKAMIRPQQDGAGRPLASAIGNDVTIMDIGAGFTELDYCLRTEFNWRGRYIPIDGAIDATELNVWRPVRRADWFVMLEIIEHLENWKRLVTECQWATERGGGVIISTPNPEVVDVLAMDDDHVHAIQASELESLGFTVTRKKFYGTRDDALFAVWRPGVGC